MEIERKFRLTELPAGLADGARIEQGYVALDGAVEVRVRRKAGSKSTLTIKSGAGLVRLEEEFELEPERFEALWLLTQERQVVKTRYDVPLDGLTVEVDEYDGELRGLLTAEVEFPSEEDAEAFEAPPWMGDEVTGDDRYANRTLAIDGLPD